MAKKKSVKKKTAVKKNTSKKKAVKKKTTKKKTTKKKSQNKKTTRKGYTKKKFKFVLSNLIFFAILTLVSYMIYSVAETYQELFMFLSIILGAISVTFLLTLLIFLFLKKSKK